jgi:hypothetical protein
MAKNKRNNQIQYVLDQIKNEVAAEMGIQELNADTTSRVCGQVGGQMTKRLIVIAEQMLQEQNKLQ